MAQKISLIDKLLGDMGKLLSSSSVTTECGIYAMETYIPAQYVDQAQLEIYDFTHIKHNCSKLEEYQGKYTKGLGQSQLAFLNSTEDIYSICLTAVHNLMQKYDISYQDIGRLSVASETILDHSKSIKSYLMQLFESSGNHDVESCDYLHACYSGSASVFDAVAWLESSSWNGKYALVVTADIAEYAKGAARPTGGVGAVAMLFGSTANPKHVSHFGGSPLLVLQPIRASFMTHLFDFFKPNLNSPYPEVDGQLSNQCYLDSLDQCYQQFCEKYLQKTGKRFGLHVFDYVVFHSPYTALVKKSFARMTYNADMMQDHLEDDKKSPESEELRKYLQMSRGDTLNDKDHMTYFVKRSAQQFERCVKPACELGCTRIGNAYTASIFLGIASLVSKYGGNEGDIKDKLCGKSVGAFSYGSGICSSLYWLTFSKNVKLIAQVAQVCDMKGKLERRHEVAADAFVDTMQRREEMHQLKKLPFRPEDEVPKHVHMDTYFLEEISAKKHRKYKLVKRNVSVDAKVEN